MCWMKELGIRILKLIVRCIRISLLSIIYIKSEGCG